MLFRSNAINARRSEIMERREFVKGVAATVAALQFIPEIAQGLTERLGKMASDLAGVTDDRLRWKRVRREFRLNPGLVHLNCGTVGASPGLVTAAVIAYMQELESDPLENMWGRSLGNQMEAVRAKAAEFLGAGTDEVVLTRNTTEGMSQVATGLDLKAGDEVLTANHEDGGGGVLAPGAEDEVAVEVLVGAAGHGQEGGVWEVEAVEGLVDGDRSLGFALGADEAAGFGGLELEVVALPAALGEGLEGEEGPAGSGLLGGAQGGDA